MLDCLERGLSSRLLSQAQGPAGLIRFSEYACHPLGFLDFRLLLCCQRCHRFLCRRLGDLQFSAVHAFGERLSFLELFGFGLLLRIDLDLRLRLNVSPTWMTVTADGPVTVDTVGGYVTTIVGRLAMIRAFPRITPSYDRDPGHIFRQFVIDTHPPVSKSLLSRLSGTHRVPCQGVYLDF